MSLTVKASGGYDRGCLFRSGLGLARKTLVDRLDHLAAGGILLREGQHDRCECKTLGDLAGHPALGLIQDKVATDERAKVATLTC